MRDVRYAFRLIRRQPMFAALVVATLTPGIGASTSMFSVVNGVLLKPLPYSDADRLVWMCGTPGRTERIEALLADSVAQPRFATLLIGSFAGLALTLTVV